MTTEFINPNWHIILIHYPIALLTLGLLIELISFLSPRSGFRAAGRWMILLGALLAVPTLTAGIYAFRDVVATDGMEMSSTWHETASTSTWSDAQWHFMRNHILYNSLAVALVLPVIVLWIASSDHARRRLYLPLLLAVAISVGLMTAGAWHGGEMVYRFGTAVRVHSAEAAGEPQRKIERYLPPLQLHVIFAGLTVASAVAALALMLGRWNTSAEPSQSDDALRQRATERLEEEVARERVRRRDALAPAPNEPQAQPAAAYQMRGFAGRVYLLAFLLALATAFFGDWSVMGDFGRANFQANLDMLKDPDHRRLLAHVIAGVAIMVLPLLLALFVRFVPRLRIIALILTLLLMAAFALQIFFGVLMLYDGHEGPLTRFNPAEVPHMEHVHEHHSPKPATHATSRSAAARPTTRAG